MSVILILSLSKDGASYSLILTFISFFPRENYLFTCKCSKCEEQVGEPDGTSEEEMEEGEDDGLED